MPSDPRIRREMEAIARSLRSHQTLDNALEALTAGAVHAISGATHASISARNPGGTLETMAATDPHIDKLDARQYELQEGPCFQAVTGQSLVVSFDLAADTRWPRYGPFAAERGIKAQLAVPLTGDGERTALNVYSDRTDEFDESSIELAEMFASHAALAMQFARTVENLGRAIDSRQRIGQATGIIMERYQIDEGQAFSFLVRLSRNSNTKIRYVADEIVTGLSGRTRLQ